MRTLIFLLCLAFSTQVLSQQIERNDDSEENESMTPGAVAAATGLGGLVLVSYVSPRMLKAKVAKKVRALERVHSLIAACGQEPVPRKLQRRGAKAESEVTRAKYSKLKGGHWSMYLAPTILLIGGGGDMFLASNDSSYEEIYEDLKEISVDIEMVDRFFKDYSENRSKELERRKEAKHERNREELESVERELVEQAKERVATKKKKELDALKAEQEAIGEDYDPSAINLDLFPDP